MLLFIFLCSFTSLICALPIITNTSSSVPLLLLISFDGFRWDYPTIYKLPHFNSLIKRGVLVKHIDNSFATVTFPSHFTIATGLYEETHGIVANTIYDPKFDEVAISSNMSYPKWWCVFYFVKAIDSICLNRKIAHLISISLRNLK